MGVSKFFLMQACTLGYVDKFFVDYFKAIWEMS